MDVLVHYNGKAVSKSDGEDKILIEPHTRQFDGLSLIEQWVTVTNDSDWPVRIERLDSVSFSVPKADYEVMYFTSAWGREFESIRERLAGEKVLCNRTGRSSQGMHPWFSLFGEHGEIITGSVMWSGNWIVRLEPERDGGYRISAGLDDWEFYKDLKPGESMESPHVAIAYGSNGDLNETSIQFARAGRASWYPKNAFSSALPVEWNHWWSYEDKLITEEVFKKNVDVAAELHFDICTLDAGWFGPSDPDTFWFDYRGDWHWVNRVRFPSGIRSLSDYTHGKGLKFGLWCEIEALGQYAKLTQTNPGLVALRDGEPIGYVCFGNPDTQEWAFQTLDRIIADYQCDWIKLDFNLDPGAGCNRMDHGHGAGDGLYEHYRGYYNVLSQIRKKHPNVILESCASGGLRIDLGLLGQTHTIFLSDPDWPEHSLQLFWGVTTMLAPNVCLHWNYSDWMGDHPYQKFNPHDPNIKDYQLDYYVRISMLGGMGFSQKLPDLPPWIAHRYDEHVQSYKHCVRKFVSHADLYRLTEQPRREGGGERWAAFQYAMPDDSEHLIFVFRLHASEPKRTIRLKHLEKEHSYKVTGYSEDSIVHYTGSQLMEEGLVFTALREEESRLMVVRRCEKGE